MLGNQAATLTLPNTTVPGTGISSVGAAYSGDVHYLPSSTGATVIETSASATTTQLTASTNNIAAGSQLTLSALVQAGTLIPPALVTTGSVAFYDGATVLCTVTVNAFGQAICPAALSAPGAHTIYAAYTPAGPQCAEHIQLFDRCRNRRRHAHRVSESDPGCAGKHLRDDYSSVECSFSPNG